MRERAVEAGHQYWALTQYFSCLLLSSTLLLLARSLVLGSCVVGRPRARGAAGDGRPAQSGGAATLNMAERIDDDASASANRRIVRAAPDVRVERLHDRAVVDKRGLLNLEQAPEGVSVGAH